MGSEQTKFSKIPSPYFLEKQINFLDEIKMLDAPLSLEKLSIVQASAEFNTKFINFHIMNKNSK